MNNQFEIGDWIFFEFELVQIVNVDKEGCIKEVSDGITSISGKSLNNYCHPLTRKNNTITIIFNYYFNQIKDVEARGLNFPDIKRYYADVWSKACSISENNADEKQLSDLYDCIQKFTNETLSKLNERKKDTINGVYLFR
jgi:hypothetical protein